MKDVRSQEEGFVQCGQGGLLQMRMSALFGAKLRIIRSLWCSHGQGVVELE